MIGVVAAVLSLLGVLVGVWPVLKKPEMLRLLTWSTKVDPALSLTGGVRIGPQVLYFPDGWILVGGVLLLVLSLWMTTSKRVVWFRRILTLLILILLGAELLAAIVSREIPYAHYAGLLYSTLMMGIAWILSMTNLGSHNALTSTLQGMPKSDFQTMVDMGKTIMEQARQMWQWNVDLQGSHSEIQDREIRIGRDPSWANVPIPGSHTYVSRKHLIVRGAGAGMSIEFVDARYSIRVNDHLHKPEEGVVLVPSPSCRLELVAGHGPTLNIRVTRRQAGMFSAHTVGRMSQILRDKYSLAKGQVRATIALLIFGVLGGGGMSWFSTMQVMARLEVFQQRVQSAQRELRRAKVQVIRNKRQADSLRREMERVMTRIEELERLGEEKEDSLRMLQARLDSLESMADSLNQTVRIDWTRLDEVVAQYAGNLEGRAVLCGATIDEAGEVQSQGTFWLGYYGDLLVLATATHVIEQGTAVILPIPSEDITLEQTTCEFLLSQLVPAVGESIVEGRASLEGEDYLLLRVGEAGWGVMLVLKSSFQEKADAAFFVMSGLPEHLRDQILPIQPYDELPYEITQAEVVPAFWIGYPRGLTSHGVGVCFPRELDSGQNLMRCNIPGYHGASGSPLILLDPRDYHVVGIVAVLSQVGQRDIGGAFSLFVTPFVSGMFTSTLP